jgi:hypothetical protein
MPKRTNPFQQLIAMVVELLENGSVVTESIEYPDPAAGNPREVDITVVRNQVEITVVRGQVGGKPVRIGIECTKLGRRATQPWVEMQYGKHSRLQVVDLVILVSDSGFSKTARKVAEQIGYLAIHPNITKSELAEVLNERFSMSLKVGEIGTVSANCTYSGPITADFKPASDGDDLMYLRSDRSVLVRAKDFWQENAARGIRLEPPNSSTNDGGPGEVTVRLDQPTHQGERIHMLVTDGESEVLATVDTLEIKAQYTFTKWAKTNLSETGNYDGNQFATGVSPIGDTEMRFVVTDVPGVGTKGMARFQYEVGKNSKVAKKRNVGKKRGKKRM